MGQAAGASALGESVIGPLGLVPATEQKARKPRWKRGRAQADSRFRADNNSGTELTTGPLGRSLFQNEQSPALTAPSQGVAAGDFHSAIHQTTPDFTTPSPYPYAPQAQSLLGSATRLPENGVLGGQKKSHLKRPREDDDETHNISSEHARLETQASSSAHITKSNHRDKTVACQLTEFLSPSSQTGHVHVKQETTQASLLPRSIFQD